MVTVNEEFNHIPKILNEIKYLGSHHIEVGIFQENNESYKDSEMTVLGIARVHEFGVEIRTKDGGTIKIPERSFMRAGFDAKKDSMERQGNALINKVLQGELKAKTALNTLGEVIRDQLQVYATELRTPPNAPSTIQQKGSSNPLVDTGLMISKIDFKVVKN